MQIFRLCFKRLFLYFSHLVASSQCLNVTYLPSWWSPNHHSHNVTYEFSTLISRHFLRSSESLLKERRIFSFAIIFMFLINFYLDHVVKLLRENWYWSFLGLKGLGDSQPCFESVCVRKTVAIIDVKRVLQHCCKTSWNAILRVLPPTSQTCLAMNELVAGYEKFFAEKEKVVLL